MERELDLLPINKGYVFRTWEDLKAEMERAERLKGGEPLSARKGREGFLSALRDSLPIPTRSLTQPSFGGIGGDDLRSCFNAAYQAWEGGPWGKEERKEGRRLVGELAEFFGLELREDDREADNRQEQRVIDGKYWVIR